MARVNRGPPLKGYVSNSRRRKTVLEVDLNVPPSENRDQEGTSAHANFLVVEPSAPIDVEAFDDDVVISSPRAFAQAKYNSRRRRGRTVVVDVDSVIAEERTSGVAPNGRNKRRRVQSNLINSDLYVNLEVASGSMRENVQSVKPVPPPPPPPKEPIFKCPICMGPFVEEMSTKCGHVFCKACIKAAIGAQGKCPTCRRKVTIKDTIRIYLPASD
ncbi:hypothetical protein RHGRI_002736 [Rhododendron griersonianum]|uniref:RING-type domain-containing protein n=1 Tax=Rhododendron griersonianum TaxID=479676 RepID=A0AAV6LT21_9ERIC|nr:hypothetical protein RHGRI_002736 [Rhododendron griersonianum]KAG5567279.1 hypothetical protein RHGRI_002736 [Rhododendron griersonianum]